ncbi:MAG: hypothetical protein CVU05_16140 [Bacteroidetes bacterium HGW-Bacteroidetes-21]|jgi:hypothetical protein|nr:MAG: hypothetical protein CVU05_16140 [Bacteroidetes bacterium HGW-Bacteroidetes-21]
MTWTGKILSILLFLCFYQLNLVAQTHELVQVKGIVINNNKEPLPFVHILDLTKGKGTISQYDGEFSFFTEKGDTLQFTCVGHKSTKKIIPIIFPEKIYHVVVVLRIDTIMLPETIILPWKTYKEFKEAVLHANVPDDDYDRAAKNLALMELQQLLYPDEMPIAAGAASRIFLYEHYDKLYWKGQSQPMQIFNIVAWQQFFEYLKDGKFKNKKKKK